MHRSRAFPVAFLVVLSACGRGPDPGAQAEALKRQAVAAAEEAGRQVDAALAAQNWTLARAQCDVLAADHPGSHAARRLTTPCADARTRAETAGENARLQGLWSYQTNPVGKGRQLNASIYSKDMIDTGAGKSRVRLIFRDHPAWGRGSYLVLGNGDFDCYGGCALKMDVDGKRRSMAGSRPNTDEAIAMFIEDERALWRTVKNARRLTITVPLKGARAQDVQFEVGGLDASRMPGW